MKKVLLICLLVLCVMNMAACEEEPLYDAVLVAEQVTDSYILNKVTTTMIWEDSVLVSIRFVQEYKDEAKAQEKYNERIEELNTSANVQLDGVYLSYNVALADWAGRSFEDVKEMMTSSKDWSIISTEKVDIPAEGK